METTVLPVTFARVSMSVLPRPVLARAVQVVLMRVRGRHPKLFTNLEALSPAVVHLLPTDLPHGFALTLGCSPITFTVIGKVAQNQSADATVMGSLEAMMDMLEGRADGDMLFFSRDIQITGNTSVIVGLRNTLDREEINLFTEITSLCGPFASSARQAITMIDHLARRVREHLSAPQERTKATPQ